MAFNLFGFIFRDKNQDKAPISFAPPQNDDGAMVVESGGINQQVVDLDGIVKNEIELITKYREMSQRAEVEGAISEIVQEAIVTEEQKTPISLVTDKMNYSDDVVQKIQKEFDNVMNFLDFNNEGQDIFRRWYTDGRLIFHMIIDPNNPRDGIKELRYIDPRRIKPVIEIESFVTAQGVPVQVEKQRYYVYNQFGTDAVTSVVGTKIAWDSILYVHSGIQETNNTMILGHLHKAMKPANMLSMSEDASVIYRLCLTGDSKIWMPYGHKEIRDLKQGDMVLSGNANGDIVVTTVKEQWCNGLKPVLRVRSQHHEIRCTPNHPLLVMDGAVAKYVDAGELIPQVHQLIFAGPRLTGEPIKMPQIYDPHASAKKGVWNRLKLPSKEAIIKTVAFTCGLGPNAVRNWLYAYQTLPLAQAQSIVAELPVPIPIVETVSYNKDKKCEIPEYITPEFAELFGFLLGDGWISRDCVSFAEGMCASTNEKYASLLKKFFGVCVHANSGKDHNYHQYRTYSTYAAQLFKALGFEQGAHNKRIPEWVYRATPEIRQSVMDGIIAADGHERSHRSGTWRCTIKLCNKKLVEDIKELWTSLGYCSGLVRSEIAKAHTMKSGLYVKECICWVVNISKTPLPKYEKIRSISDDGTHVVYDIEVESENHNFLLSGLFSHNSRAPERRVFYIDVGNLPKQRAEQYLKDIMSKYRNKMVYDASTGEIREDKRFLSFLEDYWLPRREGNRGTEITTLPGGENLGEMADVEYFKEKLYQSLNVPVGRLQSQGGFQIGRAAEITRDEVKFGKFIYRLRSRFTQLFDTLLSTQLMLKGVIAKEDWMAIRQKLHYDFLKDTYFSEMKNLEILRERAGAVDAFLNYVGKYYSHEWVRRNLLQQTDEEMKQLDSQMVKEKSDPRYQAIEAMTGGMMPGMGMGGGYGEPNLISSPGQEMGVGEDMPVVQDDGDGVPQSPDSGGDVDTDSPSDNITRNVEKLWRH